MMMNAPPAVAPAIAPDLSPGFAGTIVSTYSDGRTGRLWIHPGGDFVALGRRGDLSSGHWRLVGQQLCLRQAKPWPIPFTYCTPLPSAGASAGWTARAPTGDKVTVHVVPGHTGEPAKSTS